ncbi:MAG: hypothetical protein DBX36_00565 [Oscillospiraceae bacterium]|nr:MAG: hypothetical protein DBX36_00555 [Oscillospiraceae bacterium]PWM27851.1 MAG: hypothetical protein DBX36_00565 [Oscillospiraceae bacterium]
MENNVKAKRRVIAILSTVIALCVIIGIVLLILHIRNNTDGRSLVGTDTTENYLNQQQSSETEAETEAPKPEFEISEAGVLTAYNGDNETVVIPDNVISIGADAFGASPRVDAITTVRLGKSVEDIDVQAFVSLTKLENVEVPEENGNFIFTDGVLIKADNSVFFCMPSIIKDDYDMFDIFFDIISDKIDGEGEANLVSGDTVAGIKIVYAEDEIKELLNSKYNIYCNYFTTNNQTNQYDELVVYKDTHRLPNAKITCVYQTNEGIVFTNTDDYGVGDIWIFTEDNIIQKEVIFAVNTENRIGEEEWYNYSVVNYMKGNDGSLRYTRIPFKFQFRGGAFDYVWYCTGLDEFAGEEGVVKIENGGISYYPEKTWVVNDVMAGDYLKEMFDPDIRGYKTLEEYLAHNAEIYEPAK